MALHVQSNMRSTPINPENSPALFEDGQLTLEAMQKLVGGYVQVRVLKNNLEVEGKVYVAMGMNEDGKQFNLPRNGIATEIGLNYGAINKPDFIVGDAILFEATEMGSDDQ